MATQSDRTGASAPLPVAQSLAALAAGLGAAGLAAAAGWVAGPAIGTAAVIGFAAGMVLYHSSFGFTGAWRQVMTGGRTAGARAQIVLLAVAALPIYPLMGWAESGGPLLHGFVNPIGVPLALGAFLFGIGMQLGRGCGSGTLFAAGGGSPPMLVTLAAFVAGSVIAVLHFPTWSAWPAAPGLSVITALGWMPALALLLAVLVAAHMGLARRERRRWGAAVAIGPLHPVTARQWLRGPWSPLTGALGLAGVSVATLLATGAPWGITSAFALWGSKIAGLTGADPGSWPYWAGDPAVGASLLTDRVSVMDAGLMLGALTAAGLAGRFAKTPWPGGRALVAALIGGLLMGYGARLSTGCNIGAFLSGTLSGSLHGPLWLLFALPGSWVGIRLRPRFHLEV